MRKFYSAFRLFVHIVIISVIAIYTLSYILLSVPGIQDRARRIGIEELSALLGTTPPFPVASYSRSSASSTSGWPE